MPSIFVALAALLLRLVEPIVGRVLVALGITFITIEGFDLVLDSWATMMFTGLGDFNGAAASVISALRIVDALNVIVSATTAAFAIRGLTGGLRKMVLG